MFGDDGAGSAVRNHKVTVAAPAHRYLPSAAQVPLPSHGRHAQGGAVRATAGRLACHAAAHGRYGHPEPVTARD